jgi:hypothetical protein
MSKENKNTKRKQPDFAMDVDDSSDEERTSSSRQKRTKTTIKTVRITAKKKTKNATLKTTDTELQKSFALQALGTELLYSVQVNEQYYLQKHKLLGGNKIEIASWARAQITATIDKIFDFSELSLATRFKAQYPNTINRLVKALCTSPRSTILSAQKGNLNNHPTSQENGTISILIEKIKHFTGTFEYATKDYHTPADTLKERLTIPIEDYVIMLLGDIANYESLDEINRDFKDTNSKFDCLINKLKTKYYKEQLAERDIEEVDLEDQAGELGIILRTEEFAEYLTNSEADLEGAIFSDMLAEVSQNKYDLWNEFVNDDNFDNEEQLGCKKALQDLEYEAAQQVKPQNFVGILAQQMQANLHQLEINRRTLEDTNFKSENITEFLTNIRLANRSQKRELRNLQDASKRREITRVKNTTGMIRDDATMDWFFAELPHATEIQKLHTNGRNAEVLNMGSYGMVYNKIRGLKTDLHKNDIFIAQQLRNILQGKPLDKSISRTFHKKQFAHLAYLLFGCETARNPGQLIEIQMILDLIINKRINSKKQLSWEKALISKDDKTHIMPMVMVGAVDAQRYLYDFYTPHLPFPYQYDNDPDGKKGKAEELVKSEARLYDLWTQHMQEEGKLVEKFTSGDVINLIRQQYKDWYGVDFHVKTTGEKKKRTSETSDTKQQTSPEEKISALMTLVDNTPALGKYISGRVQQRMQVYQESLTADKAAVQNTKYRKHVVISSLPNPAYEKTLIKQDEAKQGSVGDYLIINNYGNHWDTTKIENGEEDKKITASPTDLACGCYTILHIANEFGKLEQTYKPSTINSTPAKTVRNIVSKKISKSTHQNKEEMAKQVQQSNYELTEDDLYAALEGFDIPFITRSQLHNATAGFNEEDQTHYRETIYQRLLKISSPDPLKSEQYYQEEITQLREQLGKQQASLIVREIEKIITPQLTTPAPTMNAL